MEFINKLNSEIDLVCSPDFKIISVSIVTPIFESLAQTYKMCAS